MVFVSSRRTQSHLHSGEDSRYPFCLQGTFILVAGAHRREGSHAMLESFEMETSSVRYVLNARDSACLEPTFRLLIFKP